jgi:hypothetical protein
MIMNMKNTFLAALLGAGLTLSAGEPFLLRKTGDDNSLSKLNPSVTSLRKKVQKSRMNADGESNIAIKLNLTQLGFKNISLQGEYGFHKKMTVSLGFSKLLNTKLNFYPDNEYYSIPTFSGWALTPEFRFYPGGSDDKPAPNGFYIAAYLRYAKYKLEQVVTYQETSNSKIYSATATQTYGGANFGLMIGRQWIIGKHFSLDWWIIGAGYGMAKYTYTWDDPTANLNAKQQADIANNAKSYFNDIALFGTDVDVTTTSHSATLAIKGLPMYSFRFMGLCLGYAF